MGCVRGRQVLRGFLSEDVYYAQLQQIAECERLAAECDRAMHAGSALGVAGKRPFLAALQARFGKSEEAIAELKRALDSVYGPHSELFAYGSLFAEDREMNQNDFAEAFRDQVKPSTLHITLPVCLSQYHPSWPAY